MNRKDIKITIFSACLIVLLFIMSDNTYACDQEPVFDYYYPGWYMFQNDYFYTDAAGTYTTGDSLEFTACAYDPDGGSVTYTWHMYYATTGTPVPGQNPPSGAEAWSWKPTFSESGYYCISVQVTDDDEPEHHTATHNWFVYAFDTTVAIDGDNFVFGQSNDFNYSIRPTTGWTPDRIWFAIRDSSWNLVYIDCSEYQGSSLNASVMNGTYTWNGKDSNGNWLAPGYYTVLFQADKYNYTWQSYMWYCAKALPYKVDLDIDNVSEENEDNPGGYVAVSGNRKKIIPKITPFNNVNDLCAGYVELTVTSGDNKAKFSSTETGGNLYSSLTWDLSIYGDRQNFYYYCNYGLYVQGIATSSSAMDVNITLSYYEEYNQYNTSDLIGSDSVKFTVVNFQITDSQDNVITTLQTKTVGEKVELHTKIEPSGLQPTVWLWVFNPDEENRGVVGGYSSGSTTPVTTNQSQVQFYWVDKSKSPPYLNRAYAICSIGGTVFGDYIDFNVAKPTISSSSVGAYTDPYIDSLLNKFTMDITAHAHVSKGSASDGSVKFVQLVQEYIEVTKTTGPPYNFYHSIPELWLDENDPYGDPASFENGSALITFADGPDFGLSTINNIEVNYQDFNLFLMYKSSEENSIWVPLAKMNWDWYGNAQYDDEEEEWFIVPDSSGHNTADPSLSDTTDFPEYINTSTPENPEWEEIEE